MHVRFAVMAALAASMVPVSATAAAAAADDHRPPHETIDLPAGFQGEGVTVGAGSAFYAGSVADGRIARGNLRAGTSEVFVTTPLLPAAVGREADVRHGLLWVAGGP